MKGTAIASDTITLKDGQQITVELKGCDPGCPLIIRYEAEGGGIIPYDSTTSKGPGLNDVMHVAKDAGYKFEGSCLYPKFNGSGERNGWCFIEKETL